MSNLSIKTNSQNDIFIDDNGNLVMATGVEALLQDCEHAMKAQFGEMILQPLAGLPSLADVWTTRNFIKWEAVGRKTLSAINGVVRVVSFVTSVNGSVFEYTATILTVYSNSILTVTGILDSAA